MKKTISLIALLLGASLVTISIQSCKKNCNDPFDAKYYYVDGVKGFHSTASINGEDITTVGLTGNEVDFQQYALKIELTNTAVYSFLNRLNHNYLTALACKGAEVPPLKLDNIEIYSDNAWDATHPALKDLRDLFSVYYLGQKLTMNEFLEKQISNTPTVFTIVFDKKPIQSNHKFTIRITTNGESKITTTLEEIQFLM